MAGKFPGLRTYIKRGKAGQVWVSYALDRRAQGLPELPLGTDRAEAERLWAHHRHGATRIAGTLEEAFLGWEQRGMRAGENGRERSAETLRGYRKSLASLRPVFGRATWAEVSMVELRAYVRKRTAKTRARHEMQLLSVIWHWAILEGLTKQPWPADGLGKTGWKGSPGRRTREVTDAEFAALYAAADQVVRDALDIATATGMRSTQITRCMLADVRGDLLIVQASKTGKRQEFEIADSVLADVIERRRAMRKPEHLFLLADARRRRPVGYRALCERFERARERAAESVPSCAGVWLKDMRKRAAQKAPSLAAAAELLDHSSLAVTRQHYRPATRIKPGR